ncbi:MAG: hypothetical protein Q4F21_11355 [Lachnospiraceae bacterium]|nr:hypothetical protein [Lachnospiraceae bacterium]
MNQYYYTNLADSVLYTNLRIHFTNIISYQENCYKKQEKTVLSECAEKLTELLEYINNQEDCEEVLVLSLNQICDNRLFFVLKPELIDLLKSLIIKKRLVISICEEFTLCSYTLNFLQKCILRLCKGQTNSDSVFVSSVFPILGSHNHIETSSKNALAILLGYYPACLEWKNGIFIEYDRYGNEKRRFEKFSDFKEYAVYKNGRKRTQQQHGVYTAMLKYIEEQQKNQKSEWIDQNPFRNLNSIKKFQNEEAVLFIKKLYELDEFCKKNNAFVQITDFCKKNKVYGIRDVLRLLLNNKALTGEIVDFAGGKMVADEKIKNSIIGLLKNISENPNYRNRSSIYSNLKNEMERIAKESSFAETEISEEAALKIYNHFYPKTGKAKNLLYRRTLITVIFMIDYAYNIFQCLLSTEKGIMIESYVSIVNINGGHKLGLNKKKSFQTRKAAYSIEKNEDGKEMLIRKEISNQEDRMCEKTDF